MQLQLTGLLFVGMLLNLHKIYFEQPFLFIGIVL